MLMSFFIPGVVSLTISPESKLYLIHCLVHFAFKPFLIKPPPSLKEKSINYSIKILFLIRKTGAVNFAASFSAWNKVKFIEAACVNENIFLSTLIQTI